MTDNPKLRLSHVLWIGGSPCSGKSSIAAMLAESHQLQVFHIDDAFNERHRHQLVLEERPTLHKWNSTAWNDLWMQPAGVLLEEAKAAYGEHFEMIVDDLLQLPNSPLILVEGTAVLPDRAANLMSDRRSGIWVVPTGDFQRMHYPNRGPWVQGILGQCEKPEQALKNWMGRDIAFALWVAERACALRLRTLIVDGTRSIEENAAVVARHFRLI